MVFFIVVLSATITTHEALGAVARVFVTSDTYNGNLGGLTGADAKCQAAANSADLGGTWKAWLCDDTGNASERLEHFSGNYVLVDGSTTVAEDWDDLTDGYLAHAINVTEVGGDYNSNVHTGCNTAGIYDNKSVCSSWTNGSLAYKGAIGLASSYESSWTEDVEIFCSASYSLYCFEQNPTLIEFIALEASGMGTEILITWETASEIDTAGYHISRSISESGPYEQINESLIPAKGSPTQGASYKFVDRNVEPGKTYYYKLEDVDSSGSRSFHGPVSATVAAAIPTMTETGLIIIGTAFLITSIILLMRRSRES